MHGLARESESLLGQRDFLLYWCARVGATVAYQMVSVAVGWQVYALTGRALDLGLVGLAQFLPSFVLVLLVGQVADRFDRRRTLQASVIVQAAATCALALGSHTGRIDVRDIFALVMVIGAARAFQQPAMQALLPALVPRRLLSRAIAANSSASQAAFIAGPALGGVIYVAGPGVVYGVAVLLLLATVATVAFIHLREAPAAPGKVTLRSVFAGIRFIRSRPDLLGAISLDLFAVLLGGATALLPIYARDILHAGPWALGVLRSSTAVGALAMALWLMRHPIHRHAGRIMFAAVAVFGLATIVFGVSRSFALSVAALATLGAADMISVVVRQSLVQLETPDEMRGRVSAVNALFIGTSNQLGEFESGVTAAWFGVVPSVVIGGLGTLAIVALWMRLFPALARVDRL
ncbi:MAG TPA: MFS transporter [Casimicrobiaceae bacterium]|jgi:MFS family permease